MAKRRTKEELRVEYVRLLEIWHHVRAATILQYSEATHAETSLPTSERLLLEFDEGKRPRGEMVAGMTATLNEMATYHAGSESHGDMMAKGFLAFYKQSSGRDFLADMGDPIRRIKAIVKRGRILDEDEYYSVKTALDDRGDLLSERATQKAFAMLDAFENEVPVRP